jgi:hypothetical protein
MTGNFTLNSRVPPRGGLLIPNTTAPVLKCRRSGGGWSFLVGIQQAVCTDHITLRTATLRTKCEFKAD